MAVYIGFNTVGVITPPYSITDIDLVKQDLLNQFNTKIGERVMLPDFGSIIHNMLFEPLDDVSKEIIYEDVRRVVSSDPRCELVTDPVLTEIDNGIRIEVELNFIPQDTAEHLIIEFERDIKEGI